MNDKRLRKMTFLKEELLEPEFLGDENFHTLLLGWGSLYSPLKAAVELLNASGGVKFAALVFGDVWPLPEKLLREKAFKAKRLINVEQNATGQLAQLIRENTSIEMQTSILKYDGRAISAEEIATRIKAGE
jgi:2-oxoglutarate ferredoxin oxidoreductase subunit alpha